MSDHAPDLPEKSNPLLWLAGLLTIIGLLAAWFAHWLSIGAAHGREDGPLELPKPAVVDTTDHAKLIADRSDDVIQKGAMLFARNCAQCHGPVGNTNVTNRPDPPRRFGEEPFKNTNGGGPYALFLVLTNGLNGMSPFPSLKSEEKYAVIHFIRETFVKTRTNGQFYQADDSPKVKATIPLPGQADESASKVKPSLRPVSKEVYSLLVAVAASAADERREAGAWIDRAAAGATGKVAEAIGKLGELRDSEILVELRQAVQANQRDRAVALVATSGAQRFYPFFALLSEEDFNQLFAQLQRATPAAKGAK